MLLRRKTDERLDHRRPRLRHHAGAGNQAQPSIGPLANRERDPGAGRNAVVVRLHPRRDDRPRARQCGARRTVCRLPRTRHPHHDGGGWLRAHGDQRNHGHDWWLYRPNSHDGRHPRRAARRSRRRQRPAHPCRHLRCHRRGVADRIPAKGFGRGLVRCCRNRRGVLICPGLAVCGHRPDHEERRGRERLNPAPVIPASVPLEHFRAGRLDARRCAVVRREPAVHPGGGQPPRAAHWRTDRQRRLSRSGLVRRDCTGLLPLGSGCVPSGYSVTSSRMITIGQLAAYAGVTIKAVRHYHQRGLLEEPPRDSSGYRRYSAEHAIALIKIKTLAEAGVPLARIKELLGVEPDRFVAAIAEIDRNLQNKAEELRRTRERIARLSAGDRLFVSPEVADFLDQLLELGVSQRSVQSERNGWILMQSVSPKQAAIWLADKRAALSDPEFRELYLEYEAAV